MNLRGNDQKELICHQKVIIPVKLVSPHVSNNKVTMFFQMPSTKYNYFNDSFIKFAYELKSLAKSLVVEKKVKTPNMTAAIWKRCETNFKKKKSQFELEHCVLFVVFLNKILR